MDVQIQMEELGSSLAGRRTTSLFVKLLNALTKLITNRGAIDGAADVRLAGPALLCNLALRETEGLQIAQHFLDGHSHSTNQVMYER